MTGAPDSYLCLEDNIAQQGLHLVGLDMDAYVFQTVSVFVTSVLLLLFLHPFPVGYCGAAGLAPLIESFGAPERLLAKETSCFRSLAKSIIYQQVSHMCHMRRLHARNRSMACAC